jgi:alkanesulfonate monooxygenase SsuD/methylene tetrahydromethanopterin reductase-like flavin-dependent oxidoreductase (luciferase family)
MQYGVIIPSALDASTIAEFARTAEQAGWDGVFVWDTVFGTDPWVALAAAAVRTARVRLGTMVTPLPRRRPWKLASETVALDRLSNGRLILPVGLGVAEDERWDRLGMRAEMDRRTRAELLDEGLDVLTGFWRGEPLSYGGKHYRVHDVQGRTPVQSPRIPVWVPGGGWPDVPASKLRRMLRWDGVLVGPRVDVRALRAFVAARRPEATAFDIALEGETPGDDSERARAAVRPAAEAGVTWWLEGPPSDWRADGVRTRIEQAPPRLG